jgi:hypothetical protein
MDDNIKINTEQIMREKSADLMHLAYDRRPVGALTNMKVNSLSSTKAKKFLD